MLLSDSLSLAATTLVRRLRESGFIAYFAGGCVRDALLKKPPKDIDIATQAEPVDVQRLFSRTVAVGSNSVSSGCWMQGSNSRSRPFDPTAFSGWQAAGVSYFFFSGRRC